jgi:hypothetical protein
MTEAAATVLLILAIVAGVRVYRYVLVPALKNRNIARHGFLDPIPPPASEAQFTQRGSGRLAVRLIGFLFFVVPAVVGAGGVSRLVFRQSLVSFDVLAQCALVMACLAFVATTQRGPATDDARRGVRPFIDFIVLVLLVGGVAYALWADSRFQIRIGQAVLSSDWLMVSYFTVPGALLASLAVIVGSVRLFRPESVR